MNNFKKYNKNTEYTKKIIINLQKNHVNGKYIPKKKTIKKWVKTILKKNCEITIRIVNMLEIQKINSIYRNENKPTNILSFPYQILSYTKSMLIGDLIICAKKVNEEAKLKKKKIEMYWAHIIVHGILHLLGYHHNNKYQSKIMKLMETKIMYQLGYQNIHF